MAQQSKRLKLAEKEDRISDLPDNLIQHILSFLPSTKQAIRTGALSKRWHKQWTQVPVLIFNPTGIPRRNFMKFVDDALTLHETSKVNTFHLHYGYDPSYTSYEKDPNFDEQIRFATTKQVEDLSLSCFGCRDECFLPEFLSNATSLVKLTASDFSFNLVGKVNWVQLKELKLVGCRLSDQAMEHVLSGSHLLQLLEVEAGIGRIEFDKLGITSKSLKKLVLDNLGFDVLEISCPNLEDLSLSRLKTDDHTLFGRAIDNVLSNSLLLESLMVYHYRTLHLPVIASQSLKRLVLIDINSHYSFEICCEKLEDFKLLGVMNIANVKFRNVPHSLCATINFDTSYLTKEAQNSLAEDIMSQLQHIKELRVGKFMVEKLRGFSAGDPPFPLCIKCLILDCTIQHKPLSGIMCLLQNLPFLETFGFRLFFGDPLDDMPDLDGFEESHLSSNHCLVSHLKRIKIYGILRGDKISTRVLNFIQFLLDNARVLENMTIESRVPFHEHYSSEVSRELFGFTPRSKHATVEFVSQCSRLF